MSGARDSVVDSNADQRDIERCLEAAVMWMRARQLLTTLDDPLQWELHEAASNIMSPTYDDDEGE